MLTEITIPINDNLRGLGVRSIVVGHSDMTKNNYLAIDGAPNIRVNIYFKNYYDLPVGRFRVLNKRGSCPIQRVLEVTGFVEDNPVLFKNTIKKLRGGHNGN